MTAYASTVRLAALAATVMLLSPPASAGATSDDATERYLEAAKDLPDFSESDWRLLESYISDPARLADPEITQLVTKLGRSYSDAVRAANDSGYDFGVGPGTSFFPGQPMTHSMRTLPRLSTVLLANAKFASEQGNESRTVEGITGALGIVNHLTEDVRLYSSWSALPVLDDTGRIAETLIDSGVLSSESAASVLNKLNEFDSDDPTGIRAAFTESVSKLRAWYGEFVDRGSVVNEGPAPIDDKEILAQVTEETLQEIDAQIPEYLDRAISIIEMDDHDLAKGRR